MIRFVAYDKPANFIGKEAALKDRENPRQRKLVGFVMEDLSDCDSWGDEPVWCEGKYVGNTTSGGFQYFFHFLRDFAFVKLSIFDESKIGIFGHTVGKSLALGYVDTNVAVDGAAVTIHVLGQERRAHVQVTPLLDPQSARLRM